MSDPRQTAKCGYAAVLQLWAGLTVLLGRCGSRAQYDVDRFKPALIANVTTLAGIPGNHLPDGDTINYLMERMPAAGGLGQLPGKMVNRLLRSRVLDDQRLWDDWFMMAVDATEQFSSFQRHCDQCLVQELSDGTKRYFHVVLEVMLITRSGLVLPVLSVPVRNESATYDKQDCELKAFYRMAPELHRRFPQLRICLLLDSLYFAQEVMDICAAHQWEWIITFKEGKTPALWQKAQAALKPAHRLEHQPERNTEQQFRWAHNLIHGEQRHRFHAILCSETTRSETGIVTVKNFAWGSSLRPDRNNVTELANHGGRARWKIENEGFNTLKNSIFGLEHGYGTIHEALMNWHHLIEVAFILLQLVEHSDILSKLPPPPEAGRIRRSRKPRRPVLALYNTLENFRQSLRHAFLYLRLAMDQVLAFPPFQFRLVADTA
jgi:hypothetical protein